MLSKKLLYNDIDTVAKKLARRKFKLDVVQFRQQEEIRKKLQIKTEHLQSQRNAYSKAIGTAKYRQENIDQLCIEVNQIIDILNNAKNELNIIKKKIHEYYISLPNIPADDVPYGDNEHDNKEILRWGEPSKYNFHIRDHVELGEIKRELDFTAAVKLTGTRFVVMRGQIARLHRALIQFMLDLHTEKHGYIEYYLPYLANYNSLYCTGHLPKFYEDLFFIKQFNKEQSNIYALIPTAEVLLTNLIRNEIIEENILPIKMIAHTPCFRSEAGSYGRDTRGLIRMHQFDKVEMVQVVKPTESMQALEEMTGHAEKILQLLQLPYRKMLLCTSDMSFASCKSYDLEVWLPAQNAYREISSCSNTSDFQSRRMHARYRSKKNNKLKLVHTLNGSGLAIGRTLVAVLENYQLANGCIKIPDVLHPYMKGLTYIG